MSNYCLWIKSKFFILSFFILFPFVCSCQIDTIGKVRYSPAYLFKNGLYVSFNQVLLNNPMPFERIISGNKSKDNWLDLALKTDKVIYLDDFGVQQTINTSDVWGYCNNGSLFVNWSNEFYRIPYIGRISHYVATQTVRNDYFADPYYGYYPGMNPAYETNKIIQNIIDFESGKSYPFTLETVQAFLMKDTQLFEEFNQLKKNKKKQMMFMYIRRFNDRNPLYLPE
jgi:hypothetical protein